MGWDKQTLDFYDQNAEEFVAGTLIADMVEARSRFTTYLPANACILDFGCGSGRDTKAFLDAGYQVDAIDGSEEMCAKASEYTGVQVRKMLFHELDVKNQYDGIWACASILHLPRGELAEVLKRIEAALKTNGVLYASFKYGEYEGLRNGRYFTDFTEKSLRSFLKEVTNLKPADVWISKDVRSDRKERQWINLLARRSLK